MASPPDTTKLIWDYLYLARVPYLQSTSIEYLKRYGSYTTGDREIDRELSNQWITTMININQMVEYFREGVQIKIVNYNDTKEIYAHISEHLAAWNERLLKGINIGNAPIEDLILMDEFANAVYAHAKYQFTRETVNSIVARRLSEVGRFNGSNFFKTPLPTKKDNQQIDPDGTIRINADDPNAPPERESLSDFLKDRLVGFKRF